MALFHFVNHCSSAQHYVPVNCWHLRASEKNMHVNREISSLHKHFIHCILTLLMLAGGSLLNSLHGTCSSQLFCLKCGSMGTT